jgi:hypothetical protein
MELKRLDVQWSPKQTFLESAVGIIREALGFVGTLGVTGRAAERF